MKTSVAATAAAALLLAAGTALAHHGWGAYEAAPVTLEGKIAESTYQNPHGTMKLDAAGKVWSIVLAPPSRMTSRGLAAELLAPGGTATVVGYVHKTHRDELRAERISVGGKTVELR